MGKVYLIERIDNVGYDEYAGHVVVANSSEFARQLCIESCADERGDVWRNAVIKEISTTALDEAPRIVLSSFNAG